jgi:anti-sigma-K factor RskA
VSRAAGAPGAAHGSPVPGHRRARATGSRRAGGGAVSPDAHTLTGAYALDALDEHERRLFKQHLASCPPCAQEVAELRATAARLGMAAAAEPPQRLRERVLAAVARTRQEPPLAAASRHALPPVSRRRWPLRVAVAAAALLLALSGTLGWLAWRTERQLDTAQERLSRALGCADRVTSVVGAPDAVAVTGTGATGGAATVVVSRSRGEGLLLASGLPPAPVGHTYQVWLIGPPGPRSAGLVAAGTSGCDAVLAFPPGSDSERVGVTVEPAGGSPRPTTTPLVLVSMPS